MAELRNTIIIGAGVSGLCLGAQLKRNYGYSDFEIFEKGGGVSGTWYHNTYPGAGCDVPSHLYSLSFEPNPDWSHAFSYSHEIQTYFDSVARKYDLHRHLRLRKECVGAQWNRETSTWTVRFKDLAEGTEFVKHCKMLVSAVGVLAVPRENPIPDNREYQGPAWHSAQWRHDVDLHGKDVVVVGNGCSATQFVPVVATQAKSVTQIIRGTHFYLERQQTEYGPWTKFFFRYVPGVRKVYRWLIFYLTDRDFGLFWTKNRAAREKLTRGFIEYMRKMIPDRYKGVLMPKFELGMKRRVYDTDYLDVLRRPNFRLETTLIAKAYPKGVILEDGRKVPADAIVYANGFKATELLAPLEIVGESGETLHDRWRRQGGARAYLGTAIPDFPNLAIMTGPNTLQGHTSVIFTIECCTNLIIKAFYGPLLKRQFHGVVRVTQEAEDRYNQWIQEKMSQTVWSSGDSGNVIATTTDDKQASALVTKPKNTGWYVDDKGHNPTIFPSYQTVYWWKTLWPVKADWRVTNS
ncbi:hypothetical protein PYCC9005_001413 [Savitreella phatthalungensis]